MDIQQLLQSFTENLSHSASVKSVYGEPVAIGNRIVVPAAKVRYAFGGGGGHAKDDPASAGGGGGGRVSAVPCGALEVTSEGARFIVFEDRKRMAAALALGFALGAAVAALTGTRRIEIVKRP